MDCMKIRVTWIALALAMVAAGAACSATSRSAVAGVTPGYSTPAAAVAGFLDAEVAGRMGRACAFARPDQQTSCPRLLHSATTTIPGGPLRIGDTFRLGARALVVPLGTICLDESCRSNKDRRLGLPANEAGFDQAYQTAVGTDILTTGCTKVGSRWYVDLGPLPANQPV
jgi:hypothetical protein